MKKTIISAAISLSLICVSNANAQNFSVTEQIENYRYKSGKNNSFSADKRYQQFGIKWNESGSCGEFDMDFSMQNTLKKEDFQRMMDSWIAQAKNAMNVSSLLSLSLQRANPDLYEQVMNGVAEARFQYEDDKNMCEEIQNMILDNAPQGSIDKLTIKDEYVRQINRATSGNSVDINDFTDFVHEAGDDGVEIMGEKYGGKNQNPIKAVKLASLAGFNSLTDNETSGSVNVNDSSNTRLSDEDEANYSFIKYFKSAEEVEEFVVSIVGESTLQTAENENAISHSKPLGISGKILEIESEYEEKISSIVNLMTGGVGHVYSRNAANANIEDSMPRIKALLVELNELAKPSFFTYEMAHELISLPPTVQESFINSVSKEFAYRTVVEKVFSARRIIVTGSREASIYDARALFDELTSKVSDLDREIEQLETELRVKKYHSLNAAETLLRRSLANGNNGILASPDSRIIK